MKRYAFLMKVKEGFEEEYVRRHKEVWPSVLEANKRVGIRNYSIFMNGDTLFAYLECEDFDKATKLLAEDPEVAKWEAYMAPIMELGRVNEDGRETFVLQEVFHLD